MVPRKKYCVRLSGHAARSKTAVVEALRGLTGLSRAKAKALVEESKDGPVVVQGNLSQVAAKKTQQEIEVAGGSATVHEESIAAVKKSSPKKTTKSTESQKREQPSEISQDTLKAIRWAFIGLVTVPLLLTNISSEPGGQWPLIWSILSIALVTFLAASWLEPEEQDFGMAVVGGLVIAFLGMYLLAAVQGIAATLSAGDFDPPEGAHPGTLFLKAFYAVVWWIGTAYQIAFSGEPERYSYIFRWICMFSSVGYCEEFLKVSPLLVLLKDAGKDKGYSVRSFVFIGMACGLGFGIAEGWHYHKTFYKPQELGLWMYVLRFFGCATGHAIYTGIAAAILWTIRDWWLDIWKNEITENGGLFDVLIKSALFFLLSVLTCVPTMFIHTTYNVSPPLIGIAVDVGAVMLLFWLVTDEGSAWLSSELDSMGKKL